MLPPIEREDHRRRDDRVQTQPLTIQQNLGGQRPLFACNQGRDNLVDCVGSNYLGGSACGKVRKEGFTAARKSGGRDCTSA